ncbi:MAG: hypothetical protein L0332_34010 [Chloroflexi bacterium]|nr:hypothetical protein [Chloroflexota bacterium]MCI0574607.1 hypothetical protein [Chloroflexota bacterium]MCI0644041.1 hypothetical protein [Chloroflexota bacterium]MCI0731715.1 hypothetical protein [Chloroflexota bacterium]
MTKPKPAPWPLISVEGEVVPEAEKSHVFQHPAGYLEVVLLGLVSSEEIQRLIAEATAVLETMEPTCVVINGRRGRITRNPQSFRAMRDMAHPKMKQMIVVTGRDHPHGSRGGIVVSIITSILGYKPMYFDDEAEARRVAVYINQEGSAPARI